MKRGEEFWAIQLFDQQGYYGCVTACSLEDCEAFAEARTIKHKSIILCSLPFRGRWSEAGMPDVTLPEDFKAVIGRFDRGVDDS